MNLGGLSGRQYVDAFKSLPRVAAAWVSSSARRVGSETGAGMAEYTFLLLLVAVPLALVFPTFTSAIDDALDNVASAILAAN